MNQMKLSTPWLAAAPLVSAMPMGPRRLQAEIPGDVLPGTVGYGDHIVQLLDHFLLHIEEGVPAANQQALPRMTASREGDAQVAGDRVVNRGHQGQAHVLDLQHAVTQALVVVDQVVLVAVLPQVFDRPAPEGIGLGKTAGQLARPLDHVCQGQQVSRAQGQQAVGKQVQAGQLDQAHIAHA